MTTEVLGTFSSVCEGTGVCQISWSILNTPQLPKWIDNTRENYQIDRSLVLGIPWRQITQGLLLFKMACVMLKFLASTNADTPLSDIITKKIGFQKRFSAQNYHPTPHKLNNNSVIRVVSWNLTSNKNSKDVRLASGRFPGNGHLGVFWWICAWVLLGSYYLPVCFCSLSFDFYWNYFHPSASVGN